MIVLVVNCGSSSLKYELIETETEQSLASGMADRVGISNGDGSLLKYKRPGCPDVEKHLAMPDHEVALDFVLETLISPECGAISDLSEINAIGHRVVHGGENFSESVIIDDDVIAAVEEVSKLAPLHNPANLMGIAACTRRLPDVPQVAVFDTAFHQTMQPKAYLYGLPYEFYLEHGIRRYGFHGTSHRYVSLVAARRLEECGIAPEDQKIVTCHLGNGCSMAAVLGGVSIDTTMGLTPLEGLIMGTRCGDLDPAIVTYLHDRLNLNSSEVDALLNKQCGLLGVSGVSSDMRDVKKAAAEGNMRAQAAMEIFAYRVKKYVAAFSAALHGLDAIVFTAGIGENEPIVRRLVCENLSHLDVLLDRERNDNCPKERDGFDIARPDSSVRVYVIPTNEELMIARDTAELVVSI